MQLLLMYNASKDLLKRAGLFYATRLFDKVKYISQIQFHKK